MCVCVETDGRAGSGGCWSGGCWFDLVRGAGRVGRGKDGEADGQTGKIFGKSLRPAKHFNEMSTGVPLIFR